MKYVARTLGALAVAVGCSRAPSPPAATSAVDASATEALRPSPGHEVVAETGPAGTVVRLVRRAAGSEVRCDRYEATAAAPRVPWPTGGGGAVVLASATDVPRAALLEVDAAGFIRQQLRWSAAARRFEPDAPPVIERRPGA